MGNFKNKITVYKFLSRDTRIGKVSDTGGERPKLTLNLKGPLKTQGRWESSPRSSKNTCTRVTTGLHNRRPRSEDGRLVVRKCKKVLGKEFVLNIVSRKADIIKG